MFCPNCGTEISNSVKFCPCCGYQIQQTENITAKEVVFKQENKTDFVPAMCTQCGAKIEVDPKQEAAICKYCGTPFIVSKAINNYNMSVSGNVKIESIGSVENVTIVSKVEDSDLLKIMAGNQSLKKFIKEFNEYETARQIELIPKTVKRSIFSSPRPGTIEDIDQEELARIMIKYIKAYDIPHDEASLIEFYAYCNERAHEELDEDDRLYDYRELLKEAWIEKSKKIVATGKMLYPKSESFKRMNPNRKLDVNAINSFLSDTSASDIIKAIGVIGKFIR